MREYLPPHQLFEDCLNTLHLEWHLLSNSEVNALRVVAAGELSVASLESAALPLWCVQHCQSGDAGSSGAPNGLCELAATKGSPEQNSHVGGSPTISTPTYQH
jgi:hypothetical protein